MNNWLETQIKISTFLSKKENWNPIYIHIHQTRLLIGCTLGFLIGILLSMSVAIFVIIYF